MLRLIFQLEQQNGKRKLQEKEEKTAAMKRTREICSQVNSDRLSHVQQPTTALCGTDQVSRCRLMSNCELIFCYMSGSKGKTHLGCWLTHRNTTIQKKTETRLENTKKKNIRKGSRKSRS
jgi:hypothetical protein